MVGLDPLKISHDNIKLVWKPPFEKQDGILNNTSFVFELSSTDSALINQSFFPKIYCIFR